MTTLTLNQETLFKLLGILFFATVFTKLIEQRVTPSRETLMSMIFIPLILNSAELILVLSSFFSVMRCFYLGGFIVNMFDTVFQFNIDKRILLVIFFALYLTKVFMY